MTKNITVGTAAIILAVIAVEQLGELRVVALNKGTSMRRIVREMWDASWERASQK